MKECFILKDSATENFVMPLSHSHVFFEMYILQKGKRQLYIENNDYAMSENELIIIPPQTLHRTEGDPYTRYLVNFTEDYLDEFQSQIVALCQHQKIPMTPSEAERIFYLVETMLNIQEKFHEKNSGKEYPMQVLFSYLIFELSRLKNIPTQKFVQGKSFSPRTKKILKYIEANYNTRITLESLSEQFYCSKPALYNDFKKNTGLSIIDYLLKTRLKVAKELLLNSRKNIAEIATACGFSSQEYFYLIFKKHEGISPSAYRKTHK